MPMSYSAIASRVFGRIFRLNRKPAICSDELDQLKILTARSLIRELRRTETYDDIRDAEFKVFSQFGDDGIVQYLIHATHIRSSEETFIEFGVEDYTESNTRFLLMNDNWTGLVIDSSPANIHRIQQGSLYWRHDLTAVSAFVETDNVNRLFLENGFSGEVGILSIDIDGNDYWVWKAVEVVNPVIVIAEYNSAFGNKHAVTIPYFPGFNRTRAHYSNLYWGCSLKALVLLGEQKGYTFVGSNNAGNNAYFVRNDRLRNIRPKTIESGYVTSRFRESRDREGKLTYVSPDKRLDIIRELVVYDIERGIEFKLKELKNVEGS